MAEDRLRRVWISIQFLSAVIIKPLKVAIGVGVTDHISLICLTQNRQYDLVTLGSFDGSYVSPADLSGFTNTNARVHGDENNVLKIESVSMSGSMVLRTLHPFPCGCIKFRPIGL
jgi:hypothetical protein